MDPIGLNAFFLWINFPHVPLNFFFTIFITLCRITITTKGKYTALEAEAIEALLPLVDDGTSEVRLNAIKVIHVARVQII